MEDSVNAAIIGIIRPYRYVMFTTKLLNQLPTESIEAILAHEIGHNRHKHLLIYPFILMGMLLSGWGLTTLIYSNIMQNIGLRGYLTALPYWDMLAPLILFVVFMMVIAVYFRIVFGYFSRLFERQADLYVFEIQIPAKYMIDALDRLATLLGNIHQIPNWHHHSIQERIDFLRSAEQDDTVIAQHQRKVKLSLAVYFMLLVITLVSIGGL